MKLTKEDYQNLRTLMARVSYQGLDEARAAVVLEAKLIQAAQEFDGNFDGTGADKSSSEQPSEQRE